MCGFPKVVLSGTLDDWQLLRRNTEALLEDRCDPEFAERWGAALLPLLDKFAEEYAAGAQPNPRPADERFWNSMCKRGGRDGSGGYTWFSGWINIFFPYIDGQDNDFCVPYWPSNGYVLEGRREVLYDGFGRTPEGVGGPDCLDFPGGRSSAPVVWSYLGSQIDLTFSSGFFGATQHPSGVITPVVGWLITKGKKAKTDTKYGWRSSKAGLADVERANMDLENDVADGIIRNDVDFAKFAAEQRRRSRCYDWCRWLRS